MSLPTPPPGANPFQFYLQLFSPVMIPSVGYNARLIVLTCFLATLPVSAFALFTIHCMRARRKGEKVWLFKRVKRETGSYIVGCRVPLLCIVTLVVFGTFGGAVYNAHRFTVNSRVGTREFVSSMFSFWIIFFGVSWLFTCCNLQTYLLVEGERRYRQVSAVVANTIVFVVFAVGTTILLGNSIYGLILMNQFVTSQDRLHDFLASKAIAWNGAMDPIDMQHFYVLLKDSGDASEVYFRVLWKVLAAFSVSPVPVILVNFSAILLVFVIRRQIKTNNDTLFNGSVQIATSQPVVSQSSQAAEKGQLHNQSLKYIEHGFLIDAVVVFVWSLGIMVTSLWSSILFKHIRQASWSDVETIMYSPAWAATIPVSIAMVVQVFFAWRSLPRPQNQASSGPDRQEIVLPSSLGALASQTSDAGGLKGHQYRACQTYSQ